MKVKYVDGLMVEALVAEEDREFLDKLAKELPDTDEISLGVGDAGLYPSYLYLGVVREVEGRLFEVRLVFLDNSVVGQFFHDKRLAVIVEEINGIFSRKHKELAGR